MLELIPNIKHCNPAPLTQPTLRLSPGRSSRTENGGDRLELSAAAESSAPRIRDELVQRLRDKIASGEYLTAERIEGAVDRLHEDIFGRA